MNLSKIKPWVKGLIDGLTATNVIVNTILPSKNRLALIILDSTLEIAFKDFLFCEKKIKIKKEDLEYRENLHKIVKRNTTFDNEVWERIEFYYGIRCGLYHEESAKTIPDIKEFYEIVEFIIDTLFNIKSKDFILSIDDVFSSSNIIPLIDINDFESITDKLIVVIKSKECKDEEEIHENLKKMGIKKEIPLLTIRKHIKNYHKNLFYFDKMRPVWILSNSGELRYIELTKNLNNKPE